MYLGTENNLDNLNPDINSVAKDSLGRIWFGSAKGMVVLDPKLLKQNTVPQLSKLNMIQPIFRNYSGMCLCSDTMRTQFHLNMLQRGSPIPEEFFISIS